MPGFEPPVIGPTGTKFVHDGSPVLHIATVLYISGNRQINAAVRVLSSGIICPQYSESNRRGQRTGKDGWSIV